MYSKVSLRVTDIFRSSQRYLYDQKSNILTIVLTSIVGIVVWYLVKEFYLKQKVKSEIYENPNREFVPASDEFSELYFIYATWCPYSKKAMPQWNHFKSTIEGNPKKENSLKLIEIDADEDKNESLLKSYEVQEFPTIVLAKSGTYYKMKTRTTKDNIDEFIKEHLNSE